MNLLAKTIYKEVAVYFVLLIAMLLIGNAVDLTFQLLLAVMALLAVFLFLQLMKISLVLSLFLFYLNPLSCTP